MFSAIILVYSGVCTYMIYQITVFEFRELQKLDEILQDIGSF